MQVSKVERAESELRGHTELVAALEWKPTDSNVLASVSNSDKDKAVRFWDVRAGKCTSSSVNLSGSICLAWAPDGNSLAVANNSKECAISLIDVRKGKVTKTHKVHNEVSQLRCWKLRCLCSSAPPPA